MTEDIVNLNYIIDYYYLWRIRFKKWTIYQQYITNLSKIIFMETLQVIQYSYNGKVDVSVQQMKSIIQRKVYYQLYVKI
jgi:hypothetical protein